MTPEVNAVSVLLAAGALLAVGVAAWSQRRTTSGRSGVVSGSPRGGLGRSRGARRAPLSESARWARHGDLGVLRVGPASTGRLVVGVEGGRALRRRVVAAEPAQSVAVIGPTQSGKTTSVAIPAILGWEGPVLAASVKTDLVRDTLVWRRRCGRVWCFDPARTTGLPPSSWSPVAAASTWRGAREVAADLTAVTRSDATSADGEFWYAMAAKLLAPLLFAACRGGRSMEDVVRWVDTQEAEEVVDILETAHAPVVLQALRATWLRDERQKSAVYTTAESILEPFAEPETGTWEREVVAAAQARSDHTPPFGVQALAGGASTARVLGRQVPAELEAGGAIDPHTFLSGANTLYVCAPAHDQQRLRALFVALVEQVLHAAFARAASSGRPLDPPLLVVLDEAANITPLRDLDGLAATCAGHGVQLVTVWQDLAQVRARYGERAGTVVNNHRAKLFLSGIADPGTLDFASQLAGDEERATPSVTVGRRGERTVTTSTSLRRLLPPDSLRRLPRGDGVLLYGALPPVRVRLRPWTSDPALAQRGGLRAVGPLQSGPCPTRWPRTSERRHMSAGR